MPCDMTALVFLPHVTPVVFSIVTANVKGMVMAISLMQQMFSGFSSTLDPRLQLCEFRPMWTIHFRLYERSISATETRNSFPLQQYLDSACQAIVHGGYLAYACGIQVPSP